MKCPTCDGHGLKLREVGPYGYREVVRCDCEAGKKRDAKLVSPATKHRPAREIFLPLDKAAAPDSRTRQTGEKE